MICKEISFDILPGSPFANDLFGLSSFGEMITGLVHHFSDTGAVLGLNGAWGQGKTTFLRMWEQSLKDNGYRTIFFNAWNSDYQEDPLIALVSELKDIFDKSEHASNVIATSGRFLLRFGTELGKGALKKLTGMNVDAVLDEASNIMVESIKAYQDKKQSLDDFKSALIDLISDPKNESNKPIVFIIDELDRCNPFFAIKLLERIKHLFDVPNIIFVLGLNFSQMQHAVNGFYGSERIDGKEYLRRFIDIEIELPKPDTNTFCNYILEIQDFKTAFQTHINIGWGDNDKEETLFKHTCVDLIVSHNLNLRMIFRILTFSRLVIGGCIRNQRIDSDLIFFLCFLRYVYPEMYSKIENRKYTITELLDILENSLPSSILLQTSTYGVQRRIGWLIGKLLLFYNYNGEISTRLNENFTGVKKEGSNEITYPISPSKISKKTLDEALAYYEQHDNFGYENGLKSIFNKINLANTIKL